MKTIEYVYPNAVAKDVVYRSGGDFFKIETLFRVGHDFWHNLNDDQVEISREALVEFFGEDAVKRLEARLDEGGEVSDA